MLKFSSLASPGLLYGTMDIEFAEAIPLDPLAHTRRIVSKGAYYLYSQFTKGEGEHHH